MGFWAPPCTSVAPQALPRVCSCEGAWNKNNEAEQSGPQRWETGQAGDNLVWPSSAGVHVRKDTQQRSASVRFHTHLLQRSCLPLVLTHEPSQKISLPLWGENLLTDLFYLYSNHTHTRRIMISILIRSNLQLPCRRAPNGGSQQQTLETVGPNFPKRLFVQ